ncbi:histidine kinase [Streptomyces sp. 549]|uniref:sensor histidine kinase n=1 Tax=Streptomyces sp. 549 TaxID=3049076 RepID=UPI0024C26154|nr:histidine kinase [Streptomyces sp. 549]MDK1473041.1 histidine kinase [Streptomyces sp. 549]
MVQADGTVQSDGTAASGRTTATGGTVAPKGRRWTAWWDRRSDPARIELYTRWSFYFFVLMGAAATALLALAQTGHPVWARALLPAVVLGNGVLTMCAVGRAMEWTLDRRERPSRLLAATGTLSAAVAVLGMALWRSGALTDPETLAYVVIAPPSLALIPLAANLRTARHLAALVAGTTAGALLVALALGLPTALGLGLAFGLLTGGLFMAFTTRFSMWLLAVVWELDAARDTQARLAVAEERLRFGRDLHDVMGRNLSVIALKSELAAELSRRGSSAGTDQMVEVQRIARESQRELREVVRGYREAGLDTELAGARGVLESAGIRCRIDAGDDRLPGAVQSALGWVVREGTTNVLRHSDARLCTVALRVGREAVLTMANDGVPEGRTAGRTAEPVGGASAGDASTGGHGLAGLRERLAPLGGTLEAGVRDGGRFVLTARLPLTEES